MKFYTLYKDSIVQNSLYPVVGAGLMAGLGFVFWLIVARLHPDADVGIAATLIVILTTIATLALVGIDTATIRFLAHETRKDASITTGMLTVSLAATLLAIGFILLSATIAPTLNEALHGYTRTILFVGFAVLATLNLYTDSIFLAYRTTKHTFFKNMLFSTLKIGFPFLFLSYGAFGIFVATACSFTIGFAYGLFVLMHTYGFRPVFRLEWTFLRRTRKYSIGNYGADILNFLPIALLPILIIETLGPERSAHYSIVILIAGLLYAIPLHSMNALFAEASHTEHAIRTHLRRALLVTAILLVPSILAMLLAGPLLLSLFGATYTTHGTVFLMFMSINALLIAVFSLHGTLFRIAQDTRALMMRNGLYAGCLFLCVPLLLSYDLPGVGIAYTVSLLVAGIAGHLLFLVRAPRYPYGTALKEQLSVRNLWDACILLVNEEMYWPLKTALTTTHTYVRARRNGVSTEIYFYPEVPRTYHTLYRACRELGWSVARSPTAGTTLRFRFEDTTYKTTVPEDTLTPPGAPPAINARCIDISKSRVDDALFASFGYRTRIDPRTTVGTVVKKSEVNARHDGALVTCPLEPEEGYIYQKYIDTRDHTGHPSDLRILVFGTLIPVVLKRYKSPEDIFNHTTDVHFIETHDVLTPEEQERVRSFAHLLGLDYGEIDAVRDSTDGRLYLVDANDTPAGPIGPIYRKKPSLARWNQEVQRGMRHLEDTFSRVS